MIKKRLIDRNSGSVNRQKRFLERFFSGSSLFLFRCADSGFLEAEKGGITWDEKDITSDYGLHTN